MNSDFLLLTLEDIYLVILDVKHQICNTIVSHNLQLYMF